MTVDKEALRRVQARAKMVRGLREFFGERGLHEVYTPVMGEFPCNESHLQPFCAYPGGGMAVAGNGNGSAGGGDAVDDHRLRYLQTSPESAMKRLLSRVGESLFQICPVFRAHESGSRHREEFTMVEWYRIGYDWSALMKECVELLRVCGVEFKRVERLSWKEWVERDLGCNPLELGSDELRSLAGSRGLPTHLRKDDMVGFLYESSTRRMKAEGTLYCISHYPHGWAYNAKESNEPGWSTRFEIFLGGLELVNGCEEVCDPNEQRARFEEQNRLLAEVGRSPLALDEPLLAEMARLKPCAGAAVGLERLMMAAYDLNDIGETDPLMAEEGQGEISVVKL